MSSGTVLGHFSVARDKQASHTTFGRRPLGTRSIRAAKPLLARLLHRQSVGALTGRAAFPLMASALAIASTQ